MAELVSINGKLACNDEDAENPIGATFTTQDVTYGVKRYIYLQTDIACVKGSVMIISETGLKAELVAADKINQMPIVALCTVTDEYHSWFQMEGFNANTRVQTCASLGTSPIAGDYLCLYAASQALMPNSQVGSAFAGFAECRNTGNAHAATSYSNYASADVYFRGEKGSARPLD